MKAKSPNSIDVYVGNRVRVRRKTLGMTQHGLAELLGITFQQIQKYEKGTNRIGASVFSVFPKSFACRSAFSSRTVVPDRSKVRRAS